MGKEGFVYVLLNPSFSSLVKIGKTQGTSEERAIQLYRQGKTAVPTEFVVAYENRVSDCGLVERLVHQKLKTTRANFNREFFYIPVKDAIRAVEEVVKELEHQHKLNLFQIADKELTLEEWWDELSSVWQQIFRRHLDLIYQPNEINLLVAVHSIIDHCQDKSLRNKVLKLVTNNKFTQSIEKWYNDLNKEKTLFNSYIPYKPSVKEIEEIRRLRMIDCSSNIAVIDLKPLEKLTYLEEINCSNTYISDLLPLSKLDRLEKINLNYTNIDTLDYLRNLSELIKIDCYGTNLENNEIEAFNLLNESCEIISDSFLTSEKPIKGKRK